MSKEAESQRTAAIRGEARRTIEHMGPGPIRDRLMKSLNVMENLNRGLMAEVLVAEAVGAHAISAAWDPWDVTTPDQVHVEVKSSGYVQSWTQSRPSTITFDIGPKQKQDNDGEGNWTDPTDGTKRRRSDVYVFCVHDGVCPDKPEEWMFLVVATSSLDEVCGDQQTITLGSLRTRLAPEECGYEDLAAAIRSA